MKGGEPTKSLHHSTPPLETLPLVGLATFRNAVNSPASAAPSDRPTDQPPDQSPPAPAQPTERLPGAQDDGPLGLAQGRLVRSARRIVLAWAAKDGEAAGWTRGVPGWT